MAPPEIINLDEMEDELTMGDWATILPATSASVTQDEASSTAEVQDEDELADAYLPDLDKTTDEELAPSHGGVGKCRVLAADEAIPPTDISVNLPVSTLVHRKSAFRDITEDLSRPKSEGLVVAEILAAAARQKVALREEGEQHTDTGFHEIELDDFCVYGNGAWYADQMRPLHQLATARVGTDRFFFDGSLRGGGVERRVRGIPFKELPLGNYGTEHDTVGGEVWIRSETNKRREVYYRLKEPAQEYRRFHEAFSWIADFAKHFVDFCGARIEDKCQVVLADFKNSFIQWLSTVHHSSAAVKRWRLKHGPGSDFRTAVVTHIDFLWKEAFSVLGNAVFRLDLFREVRTFDHYQKQTAQRIRSISHGPYRVASTIVTPYVYHCFKHMRLGNVLSPIGNVLTGFRPIRANSQDDNLQHKPHYLPVGKQIVDGIRPDQVISTRPDADGQSRWKNLTSRGSLEDRRWFVLVQKVYVHPKDNRRSFDVTWLYKPVDTPCGAEVYPHDDELFLSTHCTCEDGRKARIDEADILGVHNVAWPDKRIADREFFIRQTYITEERRWITWERKHMHCSHRVSAKDASRPSSTYCIGDTVLTTVEGGGLEPFEILEILDEQFSYRLRPLLRRCLIDTSALAAPANELIYTDDSIVMRASAMKERCVVRVFKAGQPVAKPYTNGGTGNLFFMTHRLVRAEDGEPTLSPISDSCRVTLRQGFDAEQAGVPKLHGLDLFCGSGNFGRGLEEGGSIEMRWANDIWDKAIHTYMANASGTVHPFLCSVDDLLHKALVGEYSNSVPAPGEVDFIAGGSPCQGFSRLTADKTTLQQIKNRSMVASFMSFVDFYRPKFGILENVLAMIRNGPKMSKNEVDDDVFSQLMCALVGLGYQTQVIMGDAWRHGAPQLRSRIFVYFAAPGLRLPRPPAQSHSHPQDTGSRSIGRMSNGEAFFEREFSPTPFEFKSAEEASSDLPDVMDGKVDVCIPFPDHRISLGITPIIRAQLALIPIYPRGMNFARCAHRKYRDMTAAERALFPTRGQRVERKSHAWGRIEPKSLYYTISTACKVAESRGGRVLHWEQSRPMTVMEARRAQGFPDEEVLLGSPVDQWKLIGNSVARPMALALGLCFREAWLGSLSDESHEILEVSDAAWHEEELRGRAPRPAHQVVVDLTDTRHNRTPPGLPTPAATEIPARSSPSKNMASSLLRKDAKPVASSAERSDKSRGSADAQASLFNDQNTNGGQAHTSRTSRIVVELFRRPQESRREVIDTTSGRKRPATWEDHEDPSNAVEKRRMVKAR